MSVYPAESGASEAIEEGAPFRLLDLPRELRDRVYHYAYVPSSSDLIITEKNRRKTLCVAKPSILLGPLHVVSHQIHDELEEYLARLPNETVTTNWVMTCGFFAVQHDATRLARCPKMTSVIFEVACTWHGWPSWFTYDAIVCYELLALVYLFRTRGTKVQTVTFDHSAEALSHGPSCVWSDRVEMRNHGVVPQKGDLKITVNVRTLEISELSGSLAPVLKMELIEALEDFQGLLLVDEPR